MAKSILAAIDFDTELKLYAYRAIAETAHAPSVSQAAAALNATDGMVRKGFARLRAKRLLVLAPGTGEIVMAPPFSAVPTPFQVVADGRAYFANCAWDALGVPAALHVRGEIAASCACCGELIPLTVEDAGPLTQPCLAHFAVPAAHWWDDIFYT